MLADGRALAGAVAREPGVRVAAPMLHEPLYGHARGAVSDANSLAYVPRTTAEFILRSFVEGGWMQVLDDPTRDAAYDPTTATGEIILNENLASLLGVRAGDDVRPSLPPAALTNDLVFRVNEITAPDFESPQEKTVYLHLGELQFVTGKDGRDAVDFIGVKLVAQAGAGNVAAHIEANHPVEAFTNDDLVREVSTLTSTFEGFAQMVGLVTLAVALLFVSTGRCSWRTSARQSSARCAPSAGAARVSFGRLRFRRSRSLLSARSWASRSATSRARRLANTFAKATASTSRLRCSHLSWRSRAPHIARIWLRFIMWVLEQVPNLKTPSTNRESQCMTPFFL